MVCLLSLTVLSCWLHPSSASLPHRCKHRQNTYRMFGLGSCASQPSNDPAQGLVDAASFIAAAPCCSCTREHSGASSSQRRYAVLYCGTATWALFPAALHSSDIQHRPGFSVVYGIQSRMRLSQHLHADHSHHDDASPMSLRQHQGVLFAMAFYINLPSARPAAVIAWNA